MVMKLGLTVPYAKNRNMAASVRISEVVARVT